MPAQYIYNANGPFATASNVDLSARVRAYTQEATVNAEEGSVAISTFHVDDEESGINITGFRNFRWKESSEGSNSRIIFDGYTADRDIDRGPFRVQRSRQWHVNVADLNSILQRRIMRGADANRPAETDVARIQWAVATTELNLLTDTTYISTSNPVAMDANDYRNQRVADIIDDCAQQSGKNYFLILNELFDPPRYGLFYDYAHSTAYSSSVRLTNVLADVDSTTTYAVFNDDLKLNRDPSRVYPAVIVAYNGGDVYVQSDTITNNFVSRDTMSPSWNIKTAAKANARGLRYLSDIGTEEDRLTMSYLVPLARVNQLKEGHTFQVKFSHLPGYTDWKWVRALKRTVKAESEEFYKVTLEATPAADSPASCSTILSGLTLSDTGAMDTSGTGHMTAPQAFAPTTPSNYPAVVIVHWVGTCGYSAIGFDPVISNFTSLFEFPQDTDHGLTSVFALVGYKALTSGAPPNFSVSWTNVPNPNFLERWEAFTIVLRTAATAPVQTARQDFTGGTATLGATPTPGNILILAKWAIQTGFTTPDPPAGFTRLGYATYNDSGPGSQDMTIELCARCVETGDSAVMSVGDANHTHWASLSEWALT